MNKQQAQEAGYAFTGIYERSYNKDKVLQRAKKLRKEGNKAIIVKILDSPYSRGGRGHGYGVYWIESKENAAKREDKARDQKRVRLQARIDELVDEMARVKEELDAIELEEDND